MPKELRYIKGALSPKQTQEKEGRVSPKMTGIKETRARMIVKEKIFLVVASNPFWLG